MTPIFGFNPSTGIDPVHIVMEALKARKSYPGKVTDDTPAFAMGSSYGLKIMQIENICPEEAYNKIKAEFEKARNHTAPCYSFPNGNGDCICATWPATIGLPIPSADENMQAYMKAMQDAPKRKHLGIKPA
ncbi:hypothetical protein KRR26_18800 [Corallococcus sp. M34]|uniref:hypothetical protein n=1 Tax=Citreicoccus inhibens TaxID=2849499 RepID=UPI001C228CA3|nr:hypothetical protein [Citreicoccus inhibens]MBU8897670.1 hypothetical protein [Citreicoccus inhibens]